MTDHLSSKNPSERETVRVSSEGGRRRFVRGAAAGVTALVTLAPRSSLAITCLSPSATASINLLHSRENRTKDICSGRSPGFWKRSPKTHPADWAASTAEGKIFGDYFVNPRNLAALTFLQVLKNGNGENSENGSLVDSTELGAHLVAAWCNWKTGRVPSTVLDEDTLKEMSDKAISGYVPIPGADPWYAADIVAFIQSTFIP